MFVFAKIFVEILGNESDDEFRLTLNLPGIVFFAALFLIIQRMRNFEVPGEIRDNIEINTHDNIRREIMYPCDPL